MDSKTSYNFFSPCRVHLKTCYGCVLDVIDFVFIVISSVVVNFLLEMCPYKEHLPPVFSFYWVLRFSNIFRKAFPYWYEYIVFFMNNLFEAHFFLFQIKTKLARE